MSLQRTKQAYREATINEFTQEVNSIVQEYGEKLKRADRRELEAYALQMVEKFTESIHAT